jgi:hypothetical protein
LANRHASSPSSSPDMHDHHDHAHHHQPFFFLSFFGWGK